MLFLHNLYVLIFCSPLAYMDPLSHNFCCIFVLLFRDALNEYSYAANIAGLKWELVNGKYGITVSTSLSEKLYVIIHNKI